MDEKCSVAILGATGLVGQKAIALLEGHRRFVISELVASEGRRGLDYKEAVQWRESVPLSDRIGSLKLIGVDEVKAKCVISALPQDVAKKVEPMLLQKGCFVSSNASTHRMERDVPLLIPEINLSHMALLDRQKGPGRLVTNSNCTTAFIALGLKPLMELGKIVHVSIVTMQAISGAGYPGVDSLDILGNLIPHIKGEEEKIVQEVKKILGGVGEPEEFGITVHVHRVPVLHGHTAALHVTFDRVIDPKRAWEAYLEANKRWPGLYRLYEAEDRPQPAKDITPYDHSVHVGRIKQGGGEKVLGLIVMGHNLVRGAAGASIQNLEALINHG